MDSRSNKSIGCGLFSCFFKSKPKPTPLLPAQEIKPQPLPDIEVMHSDLESLQNAPSFKSRNE